MNRPSPYEDDICGFWREAGQLICHGAVCDCLPQADRGGARFQTRENASLAPAFHDDPCFRLARIAGRDEMRVRIRWMHLDRKPRPHVEELQEQGETIEAPGKSAQ